MIPGDYDDSLKNGFQVMEQPTFSYRLRFDGQASSAHVQGLEAMRQVVFLILHTERFLHAMYSWNYGAELAELVGENVTPYWQARMQQAIAEALLADDRIWQVDGFFFERLSKKSLLVSFTVHTTVGELEIAYRWEGGAFA